ncbi:MAG: HNH endonuclease [Lentisphaerae bacterium]|nr:MAG: HNH endonuclease [Lentisphaerota bacterium]
MSDNFFFTAADEQHIRREKARARELRRSQWWKNRLAEGRCHYCGGTFKPSELTMDHVVPIVRGGKSTRTNVVPACRECNQDKGYHVPVDSLLDKIEQELQRKGKEPHQ